MSSTGRRWLSTLVTVALGATNAVFGAQLKGGMPMSRSIGMRRAGLMAAAVLFALSSAVLAQNVAPTNNLPNPYKSITDWAKMPAGRSWGSTAGVDIDPDGKSVWVSDRCGGNTRF